MSDLIQFKVQVKIGKVQGVCFRAETSSEAKKLGLKGWVWNHPDHSVEGVAVGSTDQISKFRKYIEKGPPAAEVKGVELIQEKQDASEEEITRALAGAKGFEVRHYKG